MTESTTHNLESGKKAHSRTSIWRFAMSFKTYGVGLGIVLATMPFISKYIDLLPYYESTKDVLTFSTSLVSLLTIAFLFGFRRPIGSMVFPQNENRVLPASVYRNRLLYRIVYPLTFIVISVVSLIIYLFIMQVSIERVALHFSYDESSGESLFEILQVQPSGQGWLYGTEREDSLLISGKASGEKDKRNIVVYFKTEKSVDKILNETASLDVPFRWPITLFYLSMFLGAVTAFVWLGLIEYIQEELGITDQNLLENPYTKATSLWVEMPDVKDYNKNVDIVYWAEYDPQKEIPTVIGEPIGPFCENHKHRQRIIPLKKDPDTNKYNWICRIYDKDQKKVVEEHSILLDFGPTELQDIASKHAQAKLERIKFNKNKKATATNKK